MQATPRLSGLTVKSTWGRHDVIIKARWNKIVVGELFCIILPDGHLRLDMIEVEEAVALPRMFRWLPPRQIKMRGKGIGASMLSELIDRAKAQSIAQIWGHIPKHLHQAWDELPEWYESHGFKLGQPDGGLKGDSVHKVIYTIKRD